MPTPQPIKREMIPKTVWISLSSDADPIDVVATATALDTFGLAATFSNVLRAPSANCWPCSAMENLDIGNYPINFDGDVRIVVEKQVVFYHYLPHGTI